MFRRFDDVIRYYRPSPYDVRDLVRNRLHQFLVARPVWTTIADAADGLSHAEIARACDDAAKDCILHDKRRVSSAALVAVLKDRHRTRESKDSS